MPRLRNLLCLIFFSVVVSAQQQHHYEHVSTRGYNVFSIYKDTEGIVWIGTSDGLFTYAQLSSQSPLFYKRSAALENIVTDIQEDNLHRLWLRLQSNAYLIYTPRNNQVITNAEDYLRKQGIQVNPEFSASIDETGRVWIFQQDKVFVRDFKANTTQQLQMPPKAGTVLAITFNGGVANILTEHALYQADVKTFALKYLSTCPVDPNSLAIFLRMTENGQTWAADRNHVFCLQNGQWRSFDGVNSAVKGLTPTKGNQMYVFTTTNGIFSFDGGFDPQHIIHTQKAAPGINGLVSNHVDVVYYDRLTDLVWVAYHKHRLSVYKQTDSWFRKQQLISEDAQFTVNDIFCMAEAPDGTWWMGTEDNGSYALTDPGTIRQHLFPGSSVTAISFDSAGRMWTGLYNDALYCSDGRRFFEGFSPYEVIEDAQGMLYVVLLGNGIQRLNPATGEVISLPTDSKWVMDVAIHGNNVYYVTNDYLYIFNTVTLKEQRLPLSVFGNHSLNYGTKAIAADSHNRIWAVSYRPHVPVKIYDVDRKKSYSVDEMDKYLIYGLVPADGQTMWFSTDKGFVSVKTTDGDSLRFEVFNYAMTGTDEGIFNDRAITMLSDHRLLAGSTDGYQVVDTKMLAQMSSQKTSLPRLIATSLRINGVYAQPGTEVNGRVLYGCDLPYLETVRLAYNENNVRLEYAPADFTQTVSVVYNYRLDNEPWQPMEDGTVNLNNIPPGKHQLFVREQSFDGEQINTYPLLTIHVASPWWASWPAIITYVLLALLLAWWVWHYLRRRNWERMRRYELAMEAEHERKSQQMKTQFFTNVSHDLRTPLSLVVSPVEELLHTVKDPEVHGMLEIVAKNANRLYDLVNRLLDIQKMDESGERLHLVHTDLVAFVKNLPETFVLEAAKRRIDFAVNAAEPQLMIDVDMEKLGRILFNLIGNSFKFTPDGGSVHIDISRQGEDAKIVVSDTGSGISEADKPHVFEKFYMSKSKYHNRHMESSGLGLSIVGEYVKMHGGKIQLSDNVPHGTIVTLLLPLKQQDEVWMEMEEDPESFNLKDSAIVDENSPTLLLVEDNLDLINYMGNILGKQYHILKATDGQQALQLLEQEQADVIISDVMMEGMDGLELCRRIKGDINLSHIPVILLTAKALAEDELEGLRMGADDYITKPFHMDVLRQRISRVLKRQQEGHAQLQENLDLEPSKIAISSLDEQLLKDAKRIIEENIGNPDFTIDTLSDELNIQRNKLFKKINALTGVTPLYFVRLLRLKRACQLLKESGLTVAEVAYQVGYNSPKRFAQHFKNEYGMTPSEYVKKETHPSPPLEGGS